MDYTNKMGLEELLKILENIRFKIFRKKQMQYLTIKTKKGKVNTIYNKTLDKIVIRPDFLYKIYKNEKKEIMMKNKLLDEIKKSLEAYFDCRIECLKKQVGKLNEFNRPIPKRVYERNKANGFCIICGEELDEPELICKKDECLKKVWKKRYKEILESKKSREKSKCYICEKIKWAKEKRDNFKKYTEIDDKKFIDDLEKHHVKYFPEQIIRVCKDCHKKIHNTDKYEYLKPEKDESKKFYGKK